MNYTEQRNQLIETFRSDLQRAAGGPVRRVLDLHDFGTPRNALENRQCNGCDYEGWESEPPDWPCRTVILIARHVGVEIPGSFA